MVTGPPLYLSLQSSEGQAAARNTDQHPNAAGQPSQNPPANAPAAQQAWSFANSMLRSYGPAAVAAGSSLFRPLRNVDTNALHADVPLDQAARRKKYDDLGVAGPSRSIPKERLYSQEVGYDVRQDRRIHSASAALIEATGATASGSAYSSYTRAQLRQRRLELERELAALENTSVAASDASDAGASSARGNSDTPSTVRDRHISLPSLPLPGQRTSPATTPPGLEASTTFERIGRDEAVDQSGLPNDWGRNADKRGWRGAPGPTELGQSQSQSQSPPPPSSARPSNQKRSSWLLWGGSNTSNSAAASQHSGTSSDNGKKNA